MLFSEGGNYAEEERETSRQRLEGLEQGIDAAAANREVPRANLPTTALPMIHHLCRCYSPLFQELKHAFIENCSKTKELIDDFNTKYASNVKDLSMREGLGKRFGGPRRSAQEKIRSEYAWSDAAQQSINDHLQRLKALIAEETNVQRQVSSGPFSQLSLLRTVNAATRMGMADAAMCGNPYLHWSIAG